MNESILCKLRELKTIVIWYYNSKSENWYFYDDKMVLIRLKYDDNMFYKYDYSFRNNVVCDIQYIIDNMNNIEKSSNNYLENTKLVKEIEDILGKSNFSSLYEIGWNIINDKISLKIVIDKFKYNSDKNINLKYKLTSTKETNISINNEKLLSFLNKNKIQLNKSVKNIKINDNVKVVTQKIESMKIKDIKKVKFEKANITYHKIGRQHDELFIPRTLFQRLRVQSCKTFTELFSVKFDD